MRSSPKDITGNSTAIPPASATPCLQGSDELVERLIAGVEIARRVGDADERDVRPWRRRSLRPFATRRGCRGRLRRRLAPSGRCEGSRFWYSDPFGARLGDGEIEGGAIEPLKG